MAVDNDATAVQGVINLKNLEYKEDIALIDARLDRLGARLSTGTDAGTEDGTPDSGTATAIAAAKVQSAAISARVDVLFPYVTHVPTS